MPPYNLYLNKEGTRRVYTREELSELTTLQLRNICYEEKIVKAVVNTLDRENLIRTILKYRGAEENYFIDEFKQNGFEKVRNSLKYLVARRPEEELIRIPAKITLYCGLGVTKDDQYKVEIEKNIIRESNVFLVNEDNSLCGIFNLVKDLTQPKLYYLVAAAHNLRLQKSNNRNYSLLFVGKVESEYFYQTYYTEQNIAPGNMEYFKIPVPDLEIRELEQTDTVLAIDFGTSNTTAGVFLNNNYVSSPCYNDLLNGRIKLNEINFVKFRDMAAKEDNYSEVIPTVVYVADCSDPGNIRYYFGYQAKKHMKKNDYTSNASVFQGIKRWVNNHNKVEEVVDEAGNVAQVSRGDIIKAFLIHVIETAESQFKCKFKNLHISCPVKLKQQFIEMFKDILSGYNVETEVLDEGLAVLYNTIADQIEKDRFVDGEEYKALVIDCGGGTTDLSSCTFTINEGKISYKVDIKTTYENGDTNFGGNNITYRILQFMKIVFAHYYTNKKENIDIDSLIEIPGADIFRSVDEIGVHKIYEKFQACYEVAEKVIPTRFKEYENRVREEYQRVKNNYYFLWELAENMKKEFFQKTNILRNKFDYTDMEEKEESDLHITTLNKWCLSILKDGRFQYVYEFPNVVFNIKEINKLIKGDIYEIVRKFLEKFYENRELQDYSIIKLTGQSCRIDMFKEALKEFVPGRSIEFKQRNVHDEHIPDLKLSCLRGVLRYINSKKIGDIEATIRNDVPFLPYSVSAFTYNKQEKVLICSLEKMNQVKGYISRPIGVREIKFYLKSQEGVLRQVYIYENDFKNYQPITPEEITRAHGDKIVQEDTDTINNGEVRFFLFAHENNWGFHVVPIARQDDQLFMDKKRFFAFEDELSELDFFDGLK